MNIDQDLQIGVALVLATPASQQHRRVARLQRRPGGRQVDLVHRQPPRGHDLASSVP